MVPFLSVGCLLPARYLCLILGLWLHLCETSWGQLEPSKQVVGANPTNREEKKSSLASENIKPTETPKKSSVVVRHLEKMQDVYKVAETVHFTILHDQHKPLVEK